MVYEFKQNRGENVGFVRLVDGVEKNDTYFVGGAKMRVLLELIRKRYCR